VGGGVGWTGGERTSQLRATLANLRGFVNDRTLSNRRSRITACPTFGRTVRHLRASVLLLTLISVLFALKNGDSVSRAGTDELRTERVQTDALFHFKREWMDLDSRGLPRDVEAHAVEDTRAIIDSLSRANVATSHHSMTVMNPIDEIDPISPSANDVNDLIAGMHNARGIPGND